MERGSGRQQRPPAHRQPTGWVRTEEIASCSSGAKRLGRNASCSSGANRLGWNGRNGVLFIDSVSGIPQNGGNGLLFNWQRSKRGPVHRLGVWLPQNGGNKHGLERLWSKWGPVHWEVSGVPQNGTPRATVHPPSSSSSLHQLLFICRLPPASMGSYSSTPNRLRCGVPWHGLLGVLFI